MDEHRIDLWFGKIKANEEDYLYFRQFLDQSELQRVEQFTNRSARVAYTESRGRLRLLLGEKLDCDPKSLRIQKTGDGKPNLADYPNFAFNQSHSGDKLIIAAGFGCLIGVDIEIIKPRYNLPGLVEKCFADEEQAYWWRTPEQEKLAEFYKFWTRKEAFVKAVGKGISLGMNTFAIHPYNPNKLLKLPAVYGAAEEWQLSDLDVSSNYCGALAVKLSSNSKHLPIYLCWHEFAQS